MQYNEKFFCPRCNQQVTYNMRKCPVCGTPFNFQENSYNPNQQTNNYQYPQYGYNQYVQYQPLAPKKKAKTWLFVTIMVTVGILFFMSLSYHFGKSISKNETNDTTNKSAVNSGKNLSGYSKSEMDKIEKGMSYARVSAIIGGDGIVVANGDTPQGEPYIKYLWRNEDNEAKSLFITFQEGKVTEFLVGETPRLN